MKQEVIFYLENLTEKERIQFQALMTKAQTKPKKWKPQRGETYFFVSSAGIVRNYNWKNDDFDKGCLKYRNCFETPSQAEFECERRKVIAELQNYADEHNEQNPDPLSPKFFLKMSTRADNTNVVYVATELYDYFTAVTYFTSVQVAEEAIKAIGEDRLKKYYFQL